MLISRMDVEAIILIAVELNIILLNDDKIINILMLNATPVYQIIKLVSPSSIKWFTRMILFAMMDNISASAGTL